MAFKEFQLAGVGAVTVYKRRGAGNIRLSIRHDGSVRVTLPAWLPFKAGLEFARKRQDWIAGQGAALAPATLADGQLIGKSHHLRFASRPAIAKPQSRVKLTEIVVTYPPSLAMSSPAVQHAARQAGIRALRQQAERLLPQKLQELARRHGLNYNSVSVRQLKSRWGSCDQNRDIVLNLFLLLLPWELIEYVLLHELTHTRVMKHGPEFWQAMAAYDPKTPQHRAAIRQYKPTL